MKYFVLIWAGLWRKKTRTILTMLSIMVAFLLYGLLQGVNQGIRATLNDTTNSRLWTSSKTSAGISMPVSLLEQMKTVKGVTSIAHLSFFGGFYQNSKNPVSVFATNVEGLAAVYPELRITAEQISAMKATRTGALIGRPVAKKYGWKVGDKVPIGTTIWIKDDGLNGWAFDVIGIFESEPQFAASPLSSAFWINYDYWDEARRFDNHRVQQFITRIDDPTHATAISAQIDKLSSNSSDETHTQTENAALQSALKKIADIDFIVNAVVYAVMFTLLFLTANTMMQSTRERIPELAVLKTLGFPSSAVCALVLFESGVLCLFAAMVGLLLSAVAVKIIGSSVGATIVPSTVVGYGVLIALVLAVISGLPPALRAQRLNIVDALAGR